LPATIQNFNLAVLCDHDSSKVAGIQFENSAVVRDCSKVLNNVFNNSSGVNFTSAAGTNTDEVTENTFNNAFTGIDINGRTTKVTLSHNIFTMGAASVNEVSLTNASNVVVDGNIFMGPGTPILKSGTTTVTASNNYCDPNDPSNSEGDGDFLNANCQTCRSSNYCVTPLAPFTFP
jgi:hypothetical protein